MNFREYIDSSILGPVSSLPIIGPEKVKYHTDNGISKYVSNYGSYRYVYFIDGQPVSAIIVVSNDKKHGKIAQAFTLESHRRQGLASQLYQQIKKDFKSVEDADSHSNLGQKWRDNLKIENQKDKEQLQKAINAFPLTGKCISDGESIAGNCDNISINFLNHAKQFGLNGTLLAVDNPLRDPTMGWKFWGGSWKDKKSFISHYIAYFPTLETGVDFTARQFWNDAEIPMILSLEKIKKLWNEFPYNLDDSRDFEDNS